MDITFNAAPSTPATDRHVLMRVSVEVMLYITIFVLALGLRIAQLADVPLNPSESHEALAALHRVQPDMTDTPAIAENPLMALVNQVLFFVATDNNFTARIGTALVGALLVMGPWLWRERLGHTTALFMAVFLCISPVALTSARLMGGVTWTMAVAMVVVWAVLVAIERRDMGMAILATVGVGAMLFLTEPTGVITALGMLFGLFMASWTGRIGGESDDAMNMVAVLRWWPWRDALLATIGAIVVVGTGFFATPAGLTSIGNTIYHLFDGFTTRPDGLPTAFALVIALRYDLGLIIFGLLGMYFALAEGDRFARFLAGWLIFSIVMAVVYQSPTSDAALWMVVPAAGLTAVLATQMLRNPSIGYWVVPTWGVPVHAFITTSLLIAIAINTTRISHVVYLEARPFAYHFIDSPLYSAELSVLDDRISQNTYDVNLTGIYTDYSFVAQIWRYAGDVEPVMRVVVENPRPDGGVEEVLIAGPFSYDEMRDGVAVSLRGGERYLIKVTRPGDQLNRNGQFAFITHPPSALESGPLFNYRLDMPFFWTVARSLSNQQLQPFTIMITVFLLLLLIISYFLAGSIWGSRAAWRGLGFGVLVYFLGYGMGLGWQTSVVYAGDPRELWHIVNPAAQHTETIVQTLEDMSIYAEGLPNTIEITVSGENDTPLAWDLRNFPSVDYVNSVGIETDTQAVIVPYDQRHVILGADYVGQDFALSKTWQLSSLGWTDFMAWLSLRESRIQPIDQDRVMMWVRKDVYGVREVIPTQSN